MGLVDRAVAEADSLINSAGTTIYHVLKGLWRRAISHGRSGWRYGPWRQGRTSYIAGPRLYTFHWSLPSFPFPPALALLSIASLFSFISISFPVVSPSFLLPLEVGFLKYNLGSGERCKLPQLGWGQSPSENRIWCVFLNLTSGGTKFY